MSDEDDNIFQQEMSGVKPLKREPRVPLYPPGGPARDSSLEVRRQAAVWPRR